VKKAIAQMTEEQRIGVPLIRRIRDVEGTLEAAVEQTPEAYTKRAVTAQLEQLALSAGKPASEASTRKMITDQLEQLALQNK